MKLKKDLIAQLCRGEGKRFKGRCQYYLPLSDECRLLKNHELREVFNKGRCNPYERLKEAVVRFLRTYKDINEPKDHLESMTTELSVRMREKRLEKGWTLAFLLSYVRNAARNEVIYRRQKDKELLKKVCRHCWHLSLSKPHTCQRPTIRTPEGEEIENSRYNQKRNLYDPACEGFKPRPHRDISLDEIPPPSIEPTEIDVSKSSEDYEPEYEMVISIQRLFSEREATAKGKRKDINKRQYLIMCRLIQLIEDGCTQREAMQRIDEELGIHKRMRERDLEAIRKVLLEKGVVKSGKHHLLIMKGEHHT